MLRKKIMMLAIFLVGMLMLSAASAEDTATADIASADETPDNDLDDDLGNALDTNAEISLNQTSDTSTDEILADTPDTFTNLNKKINDNNDTVINLDKDYLFTDDDVALKIGIEITRDLTINGNGHVIDADRKNARIFNATGCSVTFKNIKFVNGGHLENYGLAIWASHSNVTISNCSFENNSGFNGGAIYCSRCENCIISDCYFKNNIATGDYGGGIYSTYSKTNISNCTFIGNEAKGRGGEEHFGRGGGAYLASKEGSVSNCYFENNTAKEGGGLSLYYNNFEVTNCDFKNNKATRMGGAIRCQPNAYEYRVSYCNFTGNTALNGGAMAYGYALFSTFTGNHADQNGGALYCSKYSICNFSDNTAGNLENNTYGSTLVKLNTLIYSPAVTAVYNGGKYLKMTLKDIFGNPLSNANVSINLNGIINCTTDKNGQVKLSINGIVPNRYNATISYAGDENYIESTNTTNVTVKKALPKIASSPIITVYNIDKYLVIKLLDGNRKPLTGKLNVVLNGKKYTPTAKNGQTKILISNMVPKVHYAKITFAGDNCYLSTTKSIRVTVNKVTPKMIASFKVYKVADKTKKYVVTIKDNKNKVIKNAKVTIRLNAVTYIAKTNAKGQAIFKFTKLTKKGQFIATVKYAGNAYYKLLNKKYVITTK